jgi:SMI1 / KNR4 family (SUKH-1)
MELINRLNLTAPATEDALKQLQQVARIPDDYIAFLRRSNGGEGFIGSSYLIVFGAEEVTSVSLDAEIKDIIPGLIMFGSNGGAKSYAFDTTKAEESIVEFYLIDIDDEDPVLLANSLDDFFRYLSKQ